MYYNYERPLKENFDEQLTNLRFSKGLICPNCECPEAIKYGKYNNVQRYRCCACGKTFTFKSNTFLARTHNVEKWVKYIECFKKAFTIRQCAKIVGISIPTAFNWRHRLLKSINIEIPDMFIGDVEYFEKNLPLCEKGNKSLKRAPRKRGEIYIPLKYKVKLLAAVDRFGNKRTTLLLRTNVVLGDLEDDFFKVLQTSKKVFSADSRDVRYIGNMLNIELAIGKNHWINDVTQMFKNTRKCRDYVYGFLIWLGRFYGVATKNLMKYLLWHDLIKTKIEGNARMLCYII